MAKKIGSIQAVEKLGINEVKTLAFVNKVSALQRCNVYLERNNMSQMIVCFICVVFSYGVTAEIMTLDTWNKLDIKTRDDIVSWGHGTSKYSNLIFLEIRENNAETKIIDPRLLKAYKNALQFFEKEASFGVDDEYYSTIGKPSLFWLNFLYDEMHVYGVRLGFIHEGCMQADDQYVEHYDTVADAVKDRCDVNADVSWQMHGTFNGDGTGILFDDIFSWSGH